MIVDYGLKLSHVGFILRPSISLGEVKMKNIITVPILVCSLALSACQSTEVSYFMEPAQDVRISSNNSEASGGGAGWLLLGVIVLGALAYSSSCRAAQWRPVIGGAGGVYYDAGTC